MRGRRKIYFAVPFDGSKALGIWGGYRYRATPRRGGGAFFLARELYPSCSESDFFEVLAICPSVEYSQEVLWALMRRDSMRGRTRASALYTNK